jgi:hypothetical protein
METILTVAASIGTSLVAAFLWDVLARKRGRRSLLNVGRDVVRRVRGRSRASVPETLGSGPESAIPLLVRWLEEDQSDELQHFGEFGRRADLKEEKLYITNKVESIEAKPRLYLTGWPCFVLKRYGLAQNALARAQEGLELLLGTEGVIRVSLGAAPGMAPDARPTLISLRHSVRAAQILLTLDSSNRLGWEIIGKMLDPKLNWQRPDGGWSQCEGWKSSDLWASAYAIRLLHMLETMADSPYQVSVAVCQERIARTADYLETQWRAAKQWTYGQASSARNAPQIAHEVFPVLRIYTPGLSNAVHDWLLSWLTPAGTLSARYIESCNKVTPASANSRIAYALFVAGDPALVWVPLFEHAVNGFEQGVNSADAAFLLHMAIALKNGPDSEPRDILIGNRFNPTR